MRNASKIAITAAVVLVIIYIVAATQLRLAPSYNINAILADSDNQNLIVGVLYNGNVQVASNGTFQFSISFLSPLDISIKNISIATPGFTILSANATFPIENRSVKVVTLVAKAPDTGFSGDVKIVVNSTTLALERLAIEDIATDTDTKSVTYIGVRNTGSAPIQLTTIVLWRSDGAIVNSTNITSPVLQQPGTMYYYYLNLSYSPATAIEIYYVTAVTTTGINATSRAIWLNCNCG